MSRFRLASPVLAVVLAVSCMVTVFAQNNTAINRAEGAIDGVLSWRASGGSAQSLADGYLAENAGNGNAEWYAIALSALSKADMSAYAKELENAEAGGIVDRQRVALALSAVGAEEGRILSEVTQTAGKLGIMSEAFALIVMDSRAYVSADVDRWELINSILARRLDDGGWALSGSISDVDVTAMALQALAPYIYNAHVLSATVGALDMLSKRQDDSAGFSAYGIGNAESCAQVLTALCALKINPFEDERFIKGENTVFDALLGYALDSGAFSHTSGGSANDTASAQALCALTALKLFLENDGFIYGFTGKTQSVSPVTNGQGGAKRTTASAGGNTSGNTNSRVTDSSEKPPASSGSDSASGTRDVSAGEAESQGESGTDNTTATVAENGSGVDNSSTKSQGGLPLKALLLLLLLGVFALVIIGLALAQRLNKKTIIITLSVVLIIAVILLISDIKSPDEHAQLITETEVADAVGYVYLAVDASSAAEYGNTDVPQDGTILKGESVAIYAGDTAFDVLVRESARLGIAVEYEGVDSDVISTAYIEGIGGLYEFDCGELSGWRFKVNGEYPSVSCGEYLLKDADALEWVYVTQLGEDLK